MPVLTNPKHERLRELLDYNPETGNFVWRKTFFRMKEGVLAGTAHSNGYWSLRVERKPYLAHRVAWFFVNGEWPAGLIDHINGDRRDNRIANLRIANQSENIANSKRFSTNSSGFKGVSKTATGRWRAYIVKNYRQIWLGVFDSPELAHDAYKAAAISLQGDFARVA